MGIFRVNGKVPSSNDNVPSPTQLGHCDICSLMEYYRAVGSRKRGEMIQFGDEEVNWKLSSLQILSCSYKIFMLYSAAPKSTPLLISEAFICRILKI